jgi:hypothetical protein
MSDPRESFVTTSRGKRLAVTSSGSPDAEPVLLVHASGLSAAAWRRAVAHLSRSHQPIAIDLLGYGRSDPATRGAPAFASDDLEGITATLASLGRPAHLVGHSYGGYLAARAALSAPVASLLLIEPVLFGALRTANDPEAAPELSLLYDDPAFLDDEAGGSEAWMERFINYWSGEGAWAALPEAHRRANLRVAWKVYCEVRDLSGDPRPFSTYGALPATTTLARGELTTTCARRIIAHLSQALPRAAVRTIAGAGHMWPLTHPDALRETLTDHLARAQR